METRKSPRKAMRVYKIVPAGQPTDTPAVDPLKYQAPASAVVILMPASPELFTLKLRYKLPDNNVSEKFEIPVTDTGGAFTAASTDLRFASAVAEFGMLLRSSSYKGTATYDGVIELASGAKGEDPGGYRAEFIQLVNSAQALTPR